MEELREITVVKAISEWLQNAETLEVIRNEPVMKRWKTLKMGARN